MRHESIMPVAILAGGLATRLRPLTEKVPKVLLEVAGKPFLEYQLTRLVEQGVQRVVLCVGFLGEQVREQFGAGEGFGLHIDYSFDGPILLGTGGAIGRALPLLGDEFLVMYGDSYLEIDFSDVQHAFRQSGKPGLMTVFRNRDRWDQSNVWFHDGQVRSYDKRNRLTEMDFIDYGLSAFRATAFQEWCRAASSFDLADVMKELASQGGLAGYEAKRRFYEIGSHAGLQELEHILTQTIEVRLNDDFYSAISD